MKQENNIVINRRDMFTSMQLGYRFINYPYPIKCCPFVFDILYNTEEE